MTPIVNPFVAFGLILLVALLLVATVVMIMSRSGERKKLYRRCVLTLIVTLTVFIVVRFFLFNLFVDGWYFGPCETGEGIIAGMPCPETTPAREAE